MGAPSKALMTFARDTVADVYAADGRHQQFIELVRNGKLDDDMAVKSVIKAIIKYKKNPF